MDGLTDIDVIGAICDQPSAEGSAAVQLDGWHVNVTPGFLSERPHLAAFVVVPSRFRRVWAGDDPLNPTETIALRFESQRAAEDALAI